MDPADQGESQSPDSVDAASQPASEETPKGEGSLPEDAKEKTKRRFETLLSQKHEAEENLRQEREKREALERQIQQPVRTEAPPNALDYDDPAKYQQDLDAYIEDKALSVIEGRETVTQQAQTKREREALQREYVSKVSQAVDAEGMEIIANAQVPLTEAMSTLLYESDKAAEMTLYLAQNPDEAYRLSRMNDLAVAREMGRLEAGLESLTPKRVSEAPEAMTDVDEQDLSEPGGEPDASKDPQGWAKWRKQQVMARR